MLLLLTSGAVPIGLLYWLLLILWLIFGAWAYWPAAGTPAGWRPIGGNLLMFVLFVLIGLELFGFPIGR
jgi:hypothetical protein